MEYTKDEWEVEKVYPGDEDNFIDTIAYRIYSKKDPGQTLATLGVGWGNAEANANLIVASKAMYEALKQICLEHSSFVFEELAESLGNTNTRILKDAIEMGVKALAKAEER